MVSLWYAHSCPHLLWLCLPAPAGKRNLIFFIDALYELALLSVSELSYHAMHHWKSILEFYDAENLYLFIRVLKDVVDRNFSKIQNI